MRPCRSHLPRYCHDIVCGCPEYQLLLCSLLLPGPILSTTTTTTSTHPGVQFDWQYMMRGLTIDKARGNVIKVDRHKYVKLAFHGLTRMTKEDRQQAYLAGTQRYSFDTDDYTTIDTLFSLAEAYLFMQIVDLKDAGSSAMLTQKPYKVCRTRITKQRSV